LPRQRTEVLFHVGLILGEDMLEAISNAVYQKLVPHLNRPGQNISDDDPIWGTGEVAQYLGVSTDLIQKLISKREIPFFKVGDRNRFKKSKIDKWVEGRTVKPLPLTGHFSGKRFGNA
jgi:excisionase family DNA binding protein